MRLLKDIWNDDFNYCYLTTRAMLDHVNFMFFIMIPYWRKEQNQAMKDIPSKDYFGLKCILSYYVPVQTIVSPYDANSVTPLIY